MSQKLYEELAIKFSDLPNLKPDYVKSKINIFDNVLNDKFVHSYNPLRYRYYMNTLSDFKDPKILKNVIYENKMIETNKEEEDKLINDIIQNLSRLYTVTDKKVFNNNAKYAKARKEKIKTESQLLTDKIKKFMKFRDSHNKDPSKPNTNTDLDKSIEKTFLETDELINDDDNKENNQQNNDDPQNNDNGDIKKKEEKGIKFKVSDEKVKALLKSLDELNDIKIDENTDEKTVTKFFTEFNTTLKDLQDLLYDIDEYNNGNSDKMTQSAKKKLEEELDQYSKMITELKGKKNTLKAQSTNLSRTASHDTIGNRSPFGSRGGALPPNSEPEQLKKYSKDLKQKFDYNSIINNYTNRLSNVLSETDDEKIKARKLQDIINEIDYDDATSMKSLEISKEDILIFIGITFMIRLICLMIVDWALTSNFVVSFLQAYLLYIGIYFIFILLIVVIVNISYNFSLNELYNSDHGTITSLAGSLYYFYFIPGKMLQSSLRIIIHLVFILTLTMLSLFIVKGTNNTEEIISYNYSEKKHIKRQLTNFTLILWIFTSVFAIGFR